MNLEICCQCEGTTGRAGRGEDSLYTDNDWGPYCEDCWGDADYWRCCTDENLSEVERMRGALKSYAAVQPLHSKPPGQIQDDLRAIAGQEHTHVAMIQDDRCLICRHDLRHEIHAREEVR